MKCAAKWIALVAMAAFAVTGCDNRNDGQQLRLAFVTNNASDFWTIARAGCNAAVQELGDVQLDFRIPDGTAAGQKRIMDDLIARGIDGIAISPVDPINQTLDLNQAARQTLLVTHDSDAPESDRAFYVGTDNVAAGRQAGELIKEAFPDGGQIMIFVGTLDAQNAQERYRGIREVLQGSNVEILDVRTDDADRVRAKANVQDTIVRYPNINGLVGLWSYNGPAILNAVREAGKAGQIQIICFDEEDETLAGVQEGYIYSTVVQQPYEFGYQAIKLMAAVARGDESAIPEGRQQIVPTIVVNQDNVEEFWGNLRQLRGRGR
jgi:ribose transport system substrate-binding protein